MARQRLIDQVERTRKRPMRVLVLGMCCTGTTPLFVALRKLGFKPHQMLDILIKPSELSLWQEAINVTLLPLLERPIKQQNLLAYSRTEFDKLTDDYDAIMDLPGCIFSRELIQAYPKAKVILTKRNYQSWEQSMQESIWCLDTWSLFQLCRTLNISQLAPLIRLVHSVFRVHNRNTYGGPAAQSAYEEHYQTVRSLVSGNQLLELDTDSELTWDPMCEFLGVAVPKEEYPSFNEDKMMRGNLEAAWWGMVRYLILMVVLPGLVTIVAGVMWKYAGELGVLRDEWVIAPLKAYLER